MCCMSEQGAVGNVARVVGNRLYGISMRPQELALYGESVRFDVRFGPVFDDPQELVTTHYKMLVLEISADAEANPELGLSARRIELLKCGWEIELETNSECSSADLDGSTERAELQYAMEQVADTVNELARRAGLETPLGAELVAHLVDRSSAQDAN